MSHKPYQFEPGSMSNPIEPEPGGTFAELLEKRRLYILSGCAELEKFGWYKAQTLKVKQMLKSAWAMGFRHGDDCEIKFRER